ncbi:MAG: NAD-dependent epimerase/dehydratase family protein [Pontibacterium sp.]
MAHIVITGTNGFIGQHLEKHLTQSGHAVTGTSRHGDSQRLALGDLSREINPELDFTSFNCIVHLAGLAGGQHTEEEYLQVNSHSTLALAQKAAAEGLQRFVFVSSAKVNGEVTTTTPFRHDDTPSPQSLYAQSKHHSEQALWQWHQASGTAMELVVIRPPVVYGPGLAGNLSLLAKLTALSLPIPLKSIHNKRSMVGIDNLVDFIQHCCIHPNAAGKTFLVSDNEDLSTPELLKLIARAQGKSAFLLPFPEAVLIRVLKGVGLSKISESLLESSQVDIDFSAEQLQWSPPFSANDQIYKAFCRSH